MPKEGFFFEVSKNGAALFLTHSLNQSELHVFLYHIESHAQIESHRHVTVNKRLCSHTRLFHILHPHPWKEATPEELVFSLFFSFLTFFRVYENIQIPPKLLLFINQPRP